MDRGHWTILWSMAPSHHQTKPNQAMLCWCRNQLWTCSWEKTGLFKINVGLITDLGETKYHHMYLKFSNSNHQPIPSSPPSAPPGFRLFNKAWKFTNSLGLIYSLSLYQIFASSILHSSSFKTAHRSLHAPCSLRSETPYEDWGLFQNEWGRRWGGGEESPHSRCLWTSQTELPISTSPPWFPGDKHPSTPYPSQITIWSISGGHYSVCSWRWGRISHPQLPAYGLRQEPPDAAFEPVLAAGYYWLLDIHTGQSAFTAGSITVIVVPLTSIGDQLKMECSRLGLSAVVGGQVVAHWSCLKHQSSIQLGPEDMRRELLQRPHILICSAEFLASEEVNPGHILQPTVLNSGTDGHLCFPFEMREQWEWTSQFNLLRQGTSCSTVVFPHLAVDQSSVSTSARYYQSGSPPGSQVLS